MTRILFVDHAPALGGAEHSLLLLLEQLGPPWQPLLACAPGELEHQARSKGLAVQTLALPRLRRSWRSPRDWQHDVWALAQLARREHAALLHANTVRAALYAAPAAALAGLPFVWHMRDFWLSEAAPRRPWLDSLGKRLIGGSAARVIANSHAVAALLPCPAEVVHNGIALDQFDPGLDGRAFRAQHHIPLDAPLFGMVGRLRPWKGQDRLLRVAARVLRVLPNAYVLLVGGDPFQLQDGYAERLPRLATDLGLQNRVIFSGQLHDVRPALAALDVFVHPGDPEPFGLVNIEAMAMARPVVAFAHGALPEIVANGQSGLLVAPGDENALAAALIALLGNPAHRQAMGRAGRQRVAQQFRIERTAAQVAAIFESLIAAQKV